MTPETEHTNDKWAAEREHFEEGGKIQFKDKHAREDAPWYDSDTPQWNDTCVYRIHPNDLTPAQCPTCGSERKVQYDLPPSERCPDAWHTPSDATTKAEQDAEDYMKAVQQERDAATPAPEPWRPKYAVGQQVLWGDKGTPRIVLELPNPKSRQDDYFITSVCEDERGVFVAEDELKPYVWTMPTPPAGHEWHRPDGWQREWLEGDWRPLCKGEPCERGDEVFVGGKWCVGVEDTGFPMNTEHLHTRTKRPLPSAPVQAAEALANRFFSIFDLTDLCGGDEPHRVDGWTAEMLPPGTRPLCKGEEIEASDEYFEYGRGPWTQWEFPNMIPATERLHHLRTTRPAPTPSQAEPTAKTAIPTDRKKAFTEWWSGYCLDPAYGYDASEKEDHMREAFIGGAEWMKLAFAQSSRMEQAKRNVEQASNGEMPSLEALADIVREHLTCVYHCSRVWSAWSIGTMGQDDFQEAKESELAEEIATAVREACMRAKTPAIILPPQTTGAGVAMAPTSIFARGWNNYHHELMRLNPGMVHKYETLDTSSKFYGELPEWSAEEGYCYSSRKELVQTIADLRREKSKAADDYKSHVEQLYASNSARKKRITELESDLTTARESLRKVEGERDKFASYNQTNKNQVQALFHDIAALRAQSSGWLPIEHAPKDGTKLILRGDYGWRNHRTVYEGYWKLYPEGCSAYDKGQSGEGPTGEWTFESRDSLFGCQPTHFMLIPPLPTPPPSPEEGERKVITVHDPISDELLETACVILSRWLHEHPELSELVLKRTMAKGLADVAAEAATVP